MCAVVNGIRIALFFDMSRIAEALGVDIGGVIMAKPEDRQEFAMIPPFTGAFDVLRRLKQRFGDQIFIVSKCGPSVQAKTIRWLKHHHFFELTAIKQNRVYFCLEREDKAGVCARLRITHFIDDRLDVLLKLRSVEHLYLFQPQENVGTTPQTPTRVRRVSSWQVILETLL